MTAQMKLARIDLVARVRIALEAAGRGGREAAAARARLRVLNRALAWMALVG